MSKQNKLTIGLFGFGVVGEGLYKVLQQTPSLQAHLKKVCIKHPEKERNAPAALFTTNKNELLDDAEINVIVEVIDDADAAYEIIKTAFKNGKAVVSANKKAIAEHLPEFLAIQKETGLPFLYESAACASIPVIRNLEEYYDNDLLHGIKAIVNGSTNFILTRIFEENLEFSTALQQAQELGFAESDPKLDIEGYDAANKWTFLLTHAYGIVEPTQNILFNGIQSVRLSDARVAKEKGHEIKLVAQAKKLSDGKVAALVLPQFVSKNDPLASVKNEYNAVIIESGFADRQFFYGKGAGSFPTASAVLSDISALRYGYRYEYKKLYHHQPFSLADDFYLNVFVSATSWDAIPVDAFEWIDENYAAKDRCYITGVIHYDKLKNNDWWKQDDISLILEANAIIESSEIEAIRPEKVLRFLEQAC